MSTPTINHAATRGLARVVDNLDDQVQQVIHRGPPSLNEVVGLAERMRSHAGDAVVPVLDRIWLAAEAIDQAEVQITTPAFKADDLLDVDAAAITERVLDSCRNRAVLATLAHQNVNHFRDGLVRLACVELKATADATVVALRSGFDKHAKVISAAIRAGIDRTTEPAELLASGTPDQIAAFRALPAAVAGLDQIAALRNEMTWALRYGPSVHPVLSFVSGVPTALDAEGLGNRYEDPTEVVQHHQGIGGSMLTRVRTSRLGGRWLALASYPGAVKLRLNTADEVTAMHDGLTH